MNNNLVEWIMICSNTLEKNSFHTQLNRLLYLQFSFFFFINYVLIKKGKFLDWFYCSLYLILPNQMVYLWSNSLSLLPFSLNLPHVCHKHCFISHWDVTAKLITGLCHLQKLRANRCLVLPGHQIVPIIWSTGNIQRLLKGPSTNGCSFHLKSCV